MKQAHTIDTKMHGYDGLTASYLLAGEQIALIETGPKSAVDNVLGGLAAAGVESLDWIVVTHIHLDHSGAAGTLAARFPGARVAVHPIGAQHLVDPSKLWSSAARIYGDRMEALWGGVDPVDEERIHILEDGAKVDLGGRTLQAVETLGHARHHHALLDDATGALFCGDALGVSLQDLPVVRPATPPPEFDLEVALASIVRIRKLAPASLWPTHFGSQDRDVDELCEEAAQALVQWGAWVREARSRSEDSDEVTQLVKDKAQRVLEESLTEEQAARLEQTTSYAMNVSGYVRYFDKLAKAD
jgi:glyoxylase-like metal-dependent hydrolase (beta-lactamase superfamily II)